ncbi:MAG: hypothetical protein WBR29_03370 [Gammaproteobacteria bacterium]
MKSAFSIVLAVLVLSSLWASAIAADNAPFDLLKDMSVADYRATGLDKLSDAQVKALSTWFANYQSQHAKDCAQSAAMAPAVVPSAAATQPEATTKHHKKVDGSIVTTSRISGKFSGWYGGTLFKLENGQTWQQTDDSVVSLAAMRNPEVTISKGSFNVYYLQVKGMTDSVPVIEIEPNDSN